MSQDPTPPPPAPSRPRGYRVNLKTLLALVACCASLLWAWRSAQDADPTNKVVRTLRYGDVAGRREAAARLAACDGEEARRVVPALIQATADPDAQVRASAVRSLGELIRNGVLLAKLDMAREARLVGPVAVAALRDGQGDVRLAAIDSLVMLGELRRTDRRFPGPDDEAVVPALIDLVVQETNPYVRKRAADALVSLGSIREAIDPDIGPVPADLASKLAQGLGAGQPRAREASAIALGSNLFRLGAARAALLEASRDRNAPVRRAAIRSLAGFGKDRDAVLVVIEALGDDDSAVRQAASDALRNCPSPPPRGILPDLLRWLRRPEEPGHSAVVYYLWKCGPSVGALAPDLVAMADGADDRLRHDAAYLLGVVAPNSPEARRVAAILCRELAEGTPEVRQRAVVALQSYTWETERAVPAVRAALKDEDPSVRSIASSILAELANPGARPGPIAVQSATGSRLRPVSAVN
jgi:HEAT repeat protein